jgi:hypothetical protein
MPVNLTITAKTGPDRQVTAGVFNGGTGILILPDRKILQFFTGGDTNSPPEKEFDLSAATTITGTINGANGTLNLTIS